MGGHPEQQRARRLWFTGRTQAGNRQPPAGNARAGADGPA